MLLPSEIRDSTAVYHTIISLIKEADKCNSNVKKVRDIQMTRTVSLGGMKPVGEIGLRKRFLLINIKKI